jgi:hypothetical protein
MGRLLSRFNDTGNTNGLPDDLWKAVLGGSGDRI